MEIIFWSDSKRLGPAQYVNQYLVWLGPAQNILGPVEGLGICVHFFHFLPCTLPKRLSQNNEIYIELTDIKLFIIFFIFGYCHQYKFYSYLP